MTSEKVSVTVPSQASLTVGGLKAGTAGQLIGVVCATQVMLGGNTSSTTIVTLQDPELPQESEATQVLVTL